MREHPILFSGPMVRAIIADRKSQTRRIIKPQPRDDLAEVHGGRLSFEAYCPEDNESGMHLEYGFAYDDRRVWRCPYGQPGDRLWVRETWAHVPATAYRCSEGVHQTINPGDSDMAAVYSAGWDRSAPGRWRPSIHMPRWASRITLEITGVRVERLQEISEEDAKAEGCAPAWLDVDGERVNHGSAPTYRQGYARLWGEINGPVSWAANPWVWVVSFRRITTDAAMPANAACPAGEAPLRQPC